MLHRILKKVNSLKDQTPVSQTIPPKEYPEDFNLFTHEKKKPVKWGKVNKNRMNLCSVFLFSSCFFVVEMFSILTFCAVAIREETHKVDVIKFSQNKAIECSRDNNLLDRDSARLLWDFIVLLCRQNGVSLCCTQL